MKALVTCFSFIALITAGHAQVSRQEFPAAHQRIPNPFPSPNTRTSSIPPSAEAQAASGYDQLVKSGDMYFNGGNYSKAIELYNHALSIRQEQYPKDQIMRAEALNARAEKEVAILEQENAQCAKQAPQAAAGTTFTKEDQQKAFVRLSLEQNTRLKTALVCDVSGSMQAYQPIILEWIEQHPGSDSMIIGGIVLFNDAGNYRKKIQAPESAKGVYSYEPISTPYIAEKVRKAGSEGKNSEVNENNFHALLRAQIDHPECDNLLMINDNYVPWDAELAPQVTKPVHIILIPTDRAVEPVFLNLARTTKGSVSYLGETYKDLDAYNEGDVLTIGTANYVVRNGQFVVQ